MKSLILTCLIALALPAQAQKTPQMVSQAFDDFVGEIAGKDYVTASQSSTYTDGYNKQYDFTIPEKRSKAFEKFNQALRQNSPKATNWLLKKAGSESSARLAVAYGEGSSSVITFGSHKENNYNVQIFRSQQDTTMRTAYALVWHTDKDYIVGTVYKIYGKMPHCRSSRPSTRIILNGFGTADADSSASAGTSTTASTTTMTTSSGRTVTINSDGSMVVDGRVYRFGSDAMGVEVPQSSSDFIQQFTNLSTLFLTYASSFDAYKTQVTVSTGDVTKRVNLLTGTANRIMRLCKDYGRLLSKADRQVVGSGIDQMMDFCTGDLRPLSYMLESARKSL